MPEQMTDLNEVEAAAGAVESSESRLQEAVDAARRNGRSWTRIGVALGVSRQAARQRFADRSAKR